MPGLISETRMGLSTSSCRRVRVKALTMCCSSMNDSTSNETTSEKSCIKNLVYLCPAINASAGIGFSATNRAYIDDVPGRPCTHYGYDGLDKASGELLQIRR